MIGEPVASAKDLQRYVRLLVEKRRELSSALGEAQSRVPAAGGLEGDLVEQANADEEAELRIRLHQTDGRLLRAIESTPPLDTGNVGFEPQRESAIAHRLFALSLARLRFHKQ